MDKDFIRNRIASLRTQKGVAAREMSLSVGQNANYIAKIESGENWPSLPALLNICEYLHIEPKDFFDPDISAPILQKEIMDNLKSLSQAEMENIANVIRDLSNAKRQK